MRIYFYIILLAVLPSFLKGQTLTIVNGGDAGLEIGTNWSITGTVLTVSGTASIDADVVNNKLSSGNLTIKGNTTSFVVNISESISNTTHSGSVLTIGESGNTGNISITSTGSISNAGGISIYGGKIDIQGNITSSADGDIFLKSISNVNFDIDLHNGKSITKSGGNGTLTMQAHRRIFCDATSSITTSGTGKLNVILWSDYDNNNDGGVSSKGSISTNGGHVWIGGSSTNGGSYTWKGLTVGDGPSVGTASSPDPANLIDLELVGNVTTSGGDFFGWAGNGGSTLKGIGKNIASTNLINTGTGNITLITDRVLNLGDYHIRFQTTGTFILAPYDGSFPGTPSTFTWNPSVVNGTDLLLTNDFDKLEIVNYASLGGLTIGRYVEMLSGETPVVFSNSSKIQVSAATTIAAPIEFHCGDFTTSAGATVTATGKVLTVNATGAVTLNAALSGTTTTVNVQGNLQTTGSLTNVNLTGGNAQSITGTASITHLTLNKSAGTATISAGPQNVTGVLTLSQGTLAAGGLLTLKSTASGTARVAEHLASTGTVTGNVVVERYIDVNGRPKQWRTLGFPYALDMPVSRISGIGIDYTAGSSSLMQYNEGSDDGSYSGSSTARNAGYATIASGGSLTAKKGMMAWLFGASGSSASTGSMTGTVTISSYGELNESGADVILPVTYSGATYTGWNLVSNPFASSINWSGVGRTNVSASVYRWNPAASSWTSWNGSAGTPSDIGLDGFIESGGAFFVKAIGVSPVLTIPQSAKTSNATTFSHFGRVPLLDVRGERMPTPVRLAGIRVTAKGQGNPYPDEIYVDLSKADATEGFDGEYDAYSMGRTSGAGLAVKDARGGSYAMQFDRPIIEPGVEKRYYPLRVTSPSVGETTLELWTTGAWNPLNSVSLIDTRTGRTILLRDGRVSYPFRMDSLKLEGRFLLAINHVKVDRESGLPASEMKLLGNPVQGSVLDLLLTHPTAQPRQWSVVDMTGRTVAAGRFTQVASDVQHRLPVPGLRTTGSYVLQVELDNGERRQLRFLKP
jgi:hypothetical protein